MSMVPYVSLVISPCFWLHHDESDVYHVLVASEEGMSMVPCVNLGISPCFWLHPVEGDYNHVLVRCI